MVGGAEEGDTRALLLAAALEMASRHGITRLSMGDVARHAGLSRQTLYRHFPSKDALIAEVVTAETAALIDRVRAAAAPGTDPRLAMEAGLAAALRGVREHPLLDRLVTTEPEALVPLLTDASGPVMTQVRAVVTAVLAPHVPAPGGEADLARRLADLVARLLVSYAVAPPESPPEQVAAEVAALLVPAGSTTHLSAVPTGGH